MSFGNRFNNQPSSPQFPGAPSGNDPNAGANSAQGPAVQMVNAMINEAVRLGASDIHFEPRKDRVSVRFRVDGILHLWKDLPKDLQEVCVARVKILSDLDINEKRLPQDGRVSLSFPGRAIDLRISTLPLMYGEKVVMRLLDRGMSFRPLDGLDFSPHNKAAFENLIHQPLGLILVTGPTGSGKTTTLYSVLNKINTPEKNITTVEDPIEYQLSGITQVGINKKAGLNFSNSLRAFLRQDPDIIMVGEMRDLETADIAIEAALTGHLVLSTLHTNDAPSATMRLADMGVEPFLIAATVIGVLAQRLSRRICSNCKEPYQVKAAELRRFGFVTENPEEEITLYRGKGCDTCRGSGYKGRLGIYELLTMNQEIAELIVRRAPLNDIKAAALANGMQDMKSDGLYKILRGDTTPDEVMRVVFTAGF